MYAGFRERIFWPDSTALHYLILCGVAGIAGQFLITLGFRYVTAVEGGVISSTRILLAALMGPYLAADPHMTATGWIGALMIFSANVVLTARSARRSAARPFGLSSQ
jgi:drug/metabolite transporter (DMT)-like permease